MALNYWYNRADISDEKINILESHSKGIKILYVVDSSNGGSEGQYPEALMKLQNIQGYCLLLNIDEADYYKASMKAAYYYQDNTGLWRERIFVDGLLREYMIDSAGKVFYRRQTLEQLLIAEKNAITVQLHEDIAKKCEEEKIRLEKIRVAEEEEKRKQEELQRIWIERKEKADKQRAAEEEKEDRSGKRTAGISSERRKF